MKNHRMLPHPASPVSAETVAAGLQPVNVYWDAANAKQQEPGWDTMDISDEEADAELPNSPRI